MDKKIKEKLNDQIRRDQVENVLPVPEKTIKNTEKEMGL